MQDDLLQQGVELMIYGMTTVFVFLAVLVMVTMLMSTIVQRFLPAPAALPEASKRKKAATAVATDDKQLLAVITAAVHQHRSRQK